MVDHKILDTVMSKSTSPNSIDGESVKQGQLKKITRISSILVVLVSGLALFSDG